MPRKTNECRRLYLDILRVLIEAGVYPEPEPIELADVMIEKGLNPDGHRDGRRRSEAWAELRLRQLLGET